MITIVMFWAWIATINLLILTWQDYRHNMDIDDRKNYFMMGASLMLITAYSRPLYYFLIVLAVILGIRLTLNHFKVIGEGDSNALAWILYGLSIINPFKAAWFAAFFLILTIIHSIAKNVIFKYKGPVPFFSVILISFVFNCCLFGFYY